MKDILKLDNILENMIGDTDYKVPGLGVIVYQNGERVYDKFLGSRVLGKNLPMTENSKFRIASVSKMFTVFTLLQLAENGKINLDDDVNNYLDFSLRNPNFLHTPINLKMLITHTSSLRDGKVYSIPPDKSLEELFTAKGEYYENGGHFSAENEPPAKYFSYCNLNYGVLGTVIERVTGTRFDVYQKSHILKELDTLADYLPSNLKRNDFQNLGAIYQKRDNLGNWYAKIDNFKGVQPLKDTISLQNPYKEDVNDTYNLKDYKIGTNATVFSPTGGLRISLDELSHALKMLMDNGKYLDREILSEKSARSMFTPYWVYDEAKPNGDTYNGAILSYGLGIYKMQKLCKNPAVALVGHTGEAFGLLSALCFDSRTKNGFVYLLNGTAIDIDDERAKGKYSPNYIWEEMLADAICESCF